MATQSYGWELPWKPQIPCFRSLGKEAEIQRGEVIHLYAGGGAKIAILASDPEFVALSTVSSYP